MAHGCQQQHGVDYLEMFASNVRWESIQVVVAIVARMGWRNEQMNVAIAFLNGKLLEAVYTTQPSTMPL